MYETEIKDWKQVFQLSKTFLSPFIYRGQAEFGWGLQTSIERAIYHYSTVIGLFNDFEYYEKWMLHDFMRKYPRYSTIFPSKDDLFEWLAIMQHHGAATRLLDFTESLYIAFYFAVIDVKEDSAVWFVNRQILRNNLREKYDLSYDRDKDLKDKINLVHINFANSFIADQGALFNNNKIKTVIPLEPKICNERLARQQALFLMPTSSDISFEENLFEAVGYDREVKKLSFHKFIKLSNEYPPKKMAIIKICVPKELHSDIISSLSEMNISAETLFPGLDGLAKSLIQTHIRQ